MFGANASTTEPDATALLLAAGYREAFRMLELGLDDLTALSDGPAPAALFGWAAWRSGALWLPIGLHAAHNAFSVVVAGADGDVLPTVAPLVLRPSGLEITLAGTAAETVLAWLFLRWALRHRPPPVAAPALACAPVAGPSGEDPGLGELGEEARHGVVQQEVPGLEGHHHRRRHVRGHGVH